MSPVSSGLQLVLDRIYARFHEEGEWPVAERVIRELAHRAPDVRVREEVHAQREYVVLESHPEERMRLSLRGLILVAAARPLVDAYIRVLHLVVARFLDGEAESTFSSDEVAQFGLDPVIERELLTVLREDGWPFAGTVGEQPEGGWRYRISDTVLAAREVRSPEDLVAVRYGAADQSAQDLVDLGAARVVTSVRGAAHMDPDQPIRHAAEDRLHRVPLAAALAYQAATQPEKRGFVIGLTVAWGTGKTSVLNLTQEVLENRHAADVVRFDPWLFSSSEELVVRFLRELATQLGGRRRRLTGASRELISYAQVLAPIGVAAGAPWTAPILGLLARLSRGRRSQSAEAQREKVCRALRKREHRLVVVIDDLDRLDPEEIRDVVRLVKLVGDFPNVTYLLAYDPRRVAVALGGADEHEGHEFLEKIVQVAHDLPPIGAEELTKFLTDAIGEAVGDLSKFRFTEELFTNYFVAGIRRLFTTLRDVRRYANALPLALELVGQEVELADILAMEAIRLFAPGSFRLIRTSAEALTGTSGLGAGARDQSHQRRVEAIVGAAENHEEAIRELLGRLFPAVSRYFGGSSYGADWLPRWRREMRVAHPEVLAIYVQQTLPEGTLPSSVVDAVFSHLEDAPALEEDLSALNPVQLEAMLERLEHYERDFPSARPDIAVVELYNQRSRLREGKRHVFDPGADHKVGRVVLRLLRRLEPSLVMAAVGGALPDIRTLSDKLDLVLFVGHREHRGLQLVSAEDAENLERAVFDSFLEADADQLAAERDLAFLLWWASERDRERVVARLRADVEHDRFLMALLRSSTFESIGGSLGEAAMRHSYQLQWDTLTELIGPEKLAQRVMALPELGQEALADTQLRIAFEQARRYASDPQQAEEDLERSRGFGRSAS